MGEDNDVVWTGLNMRVILFVLLMTITYISINKLIFKKVQVKPVFKNLIYIAIFLGFLGLDILAGKMYGDQIGNFFETSGYTADYYVNYNTNEKTTKNYKLESTITRDEDTGEYYLLFAKWNNGGYISYRI